VEPVRRRISDGRQRDALEMRWAFDTKMFIVPLWRATRRARNEQKPGDMIGSDSRYFMLPGQLGSEIKAAEPAFVRAPNKMIPDNRDRRSCTCRVDAVAWLPGTTSTRRVKGEEHATGVYTGICLANA
jgi:hypothetical protein